MAGRRQADKEGWTLGVSGIVDGVVSREEKEDFRIGRARRCVPHERVEMSFRTAAEALASGLMAEPEKFAMRLLFEA